MEQGRSCHNTADEENSHHLSIGGIGGATTIFTRSLRRAQPEVIGYRTKWHIATQCWRFSKVIHHQAPRFERQVLPRRTSCRNVSEFGVGLCYWIWAVCTSNQAPPQFGAQPSIHSPQRRVFWNTRAIDDLSHDPHIGTLLPHHRQTTQWTKLDNARMPTGRGLRHYFACAILLI